MNGKRFWIALFMASGRFWFPPMAMATTPGRTVEVAVEPAASDNFYEARGRFWAAGGDDLRGILILLQGTDSDARSQTGSVFWRTFAQREHLGLLGIYFRGEGEPYELAGGGSGAALLKMIEQAAVNIGFDRITRVPLLLAGHSAGAMFAFNFVGWAPERVMAFASIKTGPITANPDPRIALLPGLFIVGDHDEDHRVQAAAGAFAGVHRPAAWALAVEPNTGHEWTGADSALIAIYFHALLSTGEKLGAPARLSGGSVRNLLSPFVVSTGDNRILPDTVWLPDAESANAWARFTKPAQVAALVDRVTTPEDSEVQIEPGILRLEPSEVIQTNDNEIQGSVVVKINRADLAECIFYSADPCLSLDMSPLAQGRYRLNLRLRTEGLAGGVYRTVIHFKAHDQKMTRCETALPLLVRVPSTARTLPGSLYLGVVGRGQVLERTVTIFSDHAQTPCKIRSVKSSNPAFASATPIAPQEKHSKILCKFDGSSALGNQSGHFDLVLEDGGSGIKLTLPFIAFVSKETARSVGEAGHEQQP